MKSKTFWVEGSGSTVLVTNPHLKFLDWKHWLEKTRSFMSVLSPVWFFYTGTRSTEFRRIWVRPTLEKLRSRIQIRNRIHITFRTVKYFFLQNLAFLMLEAALCPRKLSSHFDTLTLLSFCSPFYFGSRSKSRTGTGMEFRFRKSKKFRFRLHNTVFKTKNINNHC